jgi:uncharacterized membrane protein YqiK
LKKEVNPVIFIVVIVVVVLIGGILVWRFTGVHKEKESVLPGEMLGKYTSPETKQKMQQMAPGGGGALGRGAMPGPGTGGGQ